MATKKKSLKCSCGCKKFVNIDCRPMFDDVSLSLTNGNKVTHVSLGEDMDSDGEDVTETTDVPEEIKEFVHVAWSGMSVEVCLTICTKCRKVQ